MNDIFSLDIYYLTSFFAAIFAASFAIPTGALIIIVSFASVAEGWRDVVILAALSLSATVSGDYAAYRLSRRFRGSLDRLVRRTGWMQTKIITIEKLFDTYSALAIFLTRFLFSGIGPYVNFFSGLRAIPQRTFLKAAIWGEIIYCSFYIFIGYGFRNTWQAATSLAQDYAAVALFTIFGISITIKIIRLITKR